MQVLKAKEVPRGVERKQATSPRIWALPGSKQWRTRNTKEKSGKKPAAPKTDYMVSLLHGVSGVCECRCVHGVLIRSCAHEENFRLLGGGGKQACT